VGPPKLMEYKLMYCTACHFKVLKTLEAPIGANWSLIFATLSCSKINLFVLQYIKRDIHLSIIFAKFPS
jgi:hypothetical protein